MKSNGSLAYMFRRHPRMLQILGSGLFFLLCLISVALKNPAPSVLALFLVLCGIAFWDIQYRNSRLVLIALLAALGTGVMGWVLSLVTISVESQQWWSLVSSTLLSVATFATLVWTVHHTQTDKRDRRISDERHQASHVTAWIHREGDAGELYLYNASKMPVFQVVVIFDEVDYGDVSPPEGIETSPYFRSVLPPGEALVIPISGHPVCDAAVPIDKSPDVLLFRDAAGRVWIREESGSLVRTPENDNKEYLELIEEASRHQHANRFDDDYDDDYDYDDET